MMKKTKENDRKKDFVSGLLLLLLLYLLAAFMMPMLAPWEYETAYRIHLTFPDLPRYPWILRIVPLFSVFTLGGMVYLSARNFRLKRPGWAAALCLLLPPVFISGSRILVSSVLMLAVFLLFAAIQFLLHPAAPKERKYFWFLLPFGALLLVLLLRSSFSLKVCWYFPLFPFFALLIAAGVEALEARGADMGKWMDRFARFLSYSLTLLALLILLPTILRFFHLPFPDLLSPYQSERIYRPVVALLIPLLWFHLLRTTAELERKFTFFAVGAGFLMMTLPMALPWHNLIDLAPELMMRKLPEIQAGNAVCFADASTTPVLAELLQCEVRTVGEGAGEIPPEKLSSEIQTALQNSDVILGCEKHYMDAWRPVFSGIHYRAGKRVYCRYFGGKTK